MTDITHLLNEALKKHNASLINRGGRSCSRNVDEFLKEAYRIVSTMCHLSLRMLNCYGRIPISHHYILIFAPFVKPTSPRRLPPNEPNFHARTPRSPLAHLKRSVVISQTLNVTKLTQSRNRSS